MEQEVGELLTDKYPGEKVQELAKLMTNGTWTHDYPITYERALALDCALTIRYRTICCN